MKTPELLAIACAALILAGCAKTQKMMKADPAPDSGFLSDADRMAEHRERAPFNRMWSDPDFQASNYGSIFIAPVNTDHAIKMSTWAKMSARQIVIQDDMKRIAVDFRHTVVDKFDESEENHFAIVETPRDDTLILELAITELVPGKAMLGALGVASWAAPPLVGVPVGTVASFADDGWMAIEGRVRDTRSDKVLAMFADREKGKTRILDLEAATWYGHARESMNDWAEQLVTLANTPKDVEVEDFVRVHAAALVTGSPLKEDIMVSRVKRLGSLALACVVLAALASTGCGILRPTRGRHFEDAQHSGFLRDYSQLGPRDDYPAQEVYIDDAADWSRYDAVYIESVTLWVADESKAPSAEQQKMLTDMFYKSLHDKIGEKFRIVNEPGPNVVQLRAALTEARGARVVLNTVTTVIPQARLASTVLGLGTDTAALVGAASAEAEMTDAVTKHRLAAVVDSRAGTKGITRMLGKWNDVEAITNYWGERARDFLVKQGVQQKR